MEKNNKFYPGQEVLCIKTHSRNKFTKGNKYTVEAVAISPCKCRDLCLKLFGVTNTPGTMGTRCNDCGTLNIFPYDFWAGAKNFIPIDNELSEITTADILQEEPIKLDI